MLILGAESHEFSDWYSSDLTHAGSVLLSFLRIGGYNSSILSYGVFFHRGTTNGIQNNPHGLHNWDMITQYMILFDNESLSNNENLFVFEFIPTDKYIVFVRY